jgi:type II secretory pathway pseudopilin PulG
VNRQNTIIAGVLAIVVILGAGVMFGVMPQRQAANDAKDQEAELAQTNSLLNLQLVSLRKQKEDMSELNRELAKLRRQIPATADLASVTRVIVKALRTPAQERGATLVSITPQVPPVAFVPGEQLTPDIAVPTAPAIAPPASGEPTPLEPGTFQMIPLQIEATAPTVRDAFIFVDLLNAGPRLLGVHYVSVQEGAEASGGAEGADPVRISVVAAAYLQPTAKAAPTTEQPAG